MTLREARFWAAGIAAIEQRKQRDMLLLMRASTADKETFNDVLRTLE